jgi:hypothetical protein
MKSIWRVWRGMVALGAFAQKVNHGGLIRATNQG